MYYPSIRPTPSATISKVPVHLHVVVASSTDTATQRIHHSDAASLALSRAMGHLMNSMTRSLGDIERHGFLHFASADYEILLAVAKNLL